MIDAAQRRACSSRWRTIRGVKPALISRRRRVCSRPSMLTIIEPRMKG